MEIARFSEKLVSYTSNTLRHNPHTYKIVVNNNNNDNTINNNKKLISVCCEDVNWVEWGCLWRFILAV